MVLSLLHAQTVCVSFSALQRAENSSIYNENLYSVVNQRFQCSSASRKFLNQEGGDAMALVPDRFSALQRAENSSIVLITRYNNVLPAQFQCSSASRKFLNYMRINISSPVQLVSVLFSEPKIPQSFIQTGCGDSFRFQCSSASRKFLNDR